MQTWVTSDLHLFHDNIIVYCGRPHCSAAEMNDSIVREWNRAVAPGDRVIVVGDLSAGLQRRQNMLAEIIRELNGDKVLIRGNHDHESDGWYIDAGFSSVQDWMLDDGFLYIHKPATQMNPLSIKIREENRHRLVVHGHIHDNRPQIPGHFNVAWDRFYRLVNLEEIKSATTRF